MFVFGLDLAGKSTLVQQLKKGVFISTSPTLTTDVQKITFGDLQIRVFDMAGQLRFRGEWLQYLGSHIKALVFVVDSAQPNRFPEAKMELDRILTDERSSNLPLLFCANKADLENSVPYETINESFKLGDISNRRVKLLKVSALTRMGVLGVFDWLGTMLLADREEFS